MSIKKFNKASLAMAVAGALAASSAQAVNIAEDGLGDFIFGQYYTVRDGWNTYINVTNTSEETVAFKIRFREMYDSRDVRDFNVVLSPYDVWTAALVENADGAARLVTQDRTCTVPAYIRDDGVDFTNLFYTGAMADGGPEDLARTTEGYFEVINMGQDSEVTVSDNDSDLAYNAEHVDGEPRDCTAVEDMFRPANIPALSAVIDEPENSLKVNVALIQVADGMGISYEPVTLANFYNPLLVDGIATNDLLFPASATQPNFTDGLPNTSEIRLNAVGANLVSNWTVAGDAVSAVIMRNAAINQYRSDAADPAAETDWVVTFPTKWAYVDPIFGIGIPRDPFVEIFDGESCVTVAYNQWDREERSPVVTTEVPPSPYIPTVDVDALCYEVNTLEYGDGVLMSQDPYEVNSPYLQGWTRMDVGLDYDLSNILINQMADNNGVVYQGLPMIGMAVSNLDNPLAGNENVQYGFAWNHSYTRSIVGTVSNTYTSNGLPAGTYSNVSGL